MKTIHGPDIRFEVLLMSAPVLAMLVATLAAQGCKPPAGTPPGAATTRPAENELTEHDSSGDIRKKTDSLAPGERPEQARRVLAELVQANPDDGQLREWYGDALASTYHWDEALQYLAPSQHRCVAASYLGLGETRKALGEFRTTFEHLPMEADLCFLAKIAFVAGETKDADRLWRQAAHDGCDPVLLYVSMRSAGVEDSPLLAGIKLPSYSDAMAEEYRVQRLYSYLTYYGIIAQEQPPFVQLQDGLTAPGRRATSPFPSSSMNELFDGVRVLAGAGDAGAFAAVGDGFYIRGEMDKAAWFYGEALKTRRRMISMCDAAWASFQLLRIRDAETARHDAPDGK